MIGGRLPFRKLRIAFGQALQFGSLRRRAFGHGAYRQPVGERPEMISEGVLVSLFHIGRIIRWKFALR
jgi:hypothetical protein